MAYNTAIRTAFAQTVLDALNGAATPAILEIGTASFSTTLAQIVLGDPAGTISNVSGNIVLTFANLPKSDSSANNSGRIRAARLTDGDSLLVRDGLTVGLLGAAATAWGGSTVYSVGTKRANGGNVYRVTTAGTSASSGGPTGTSSSISDGTVVWEYLAPQYGDLIVNEVDVEAGQQVTINSLTFTWAA